MTGWTEDELRRLERADELLIAPARADGGFRGDVPIWVVRVGDDVVVRSWRGPGAAWYRHATGTGRARIRAGGVERVVSLTPPMDDAQRQAVDAAYLAKYGPGGYAPEMIAPQAVETTLLLEPED